MFSLHVSLRHVLDKAERLGSAGFTLACLSAAGKASTHCRQFSAL